MIYSEKRLMTSFHMCSGPMAVAQRRLNSGAVSELIEHHGLMMFRVGAGSGDRCPSGSRRQQSPLVIRAPGHASQPVNGIVLASVANAPAASATFTLPAAAGSPLLLGHNWYIWPNTRYANSFKLWCTVTAVAVLHFAVADAAVAGGGGVARAAVVALCPIAGIVGWLACAPKWLGAWMTTMAAVGVVGDHDGNQDGRRARADGDTGPVQTN